MTGALRGRTDALPHRSPTPPERRAAVVLTGPAAPTRTRWAGSLGIVGALLLGLLLAGDRPALASPVEGLLQLPADFEPDKPEFSAPGYWFDLSNEVLKKRPPLVDPRQKMVVVLEGSGLVKTDLVKPELHLKDARLWPPVLPVRPGQTITVKNEDRHLHRLKPATGPAFMQELPLPQGTSGTLSLKDEGTYPLTCVEMPHIAATIVVADAPIMVLPDEKGAFQIPDVPPGRYTLRVLFRGAAIHRQAVEVESKKTQITVALPGSDAKE